jgi:hypothetical protein
MKREKRKNWWNTKKKDKKEHRKERKQKKNWQNYKKEVKKRKEKKEKRKIDEKSKSMRRVDDLEIDFISLSRLCFMRFKPK